MNTRLAIVISLILGGSNLATAAAIPDSRSAAARADAEAMFEVGESSDPRQAFHWYMRAASLGHVEAMNRLGLLYSEGSGVPQDYVAALEWYRRAAAHGSEPAVCNIATLYFYGFGVEQSYAEAADLLQAAAQRGSVDAQNKLGTLYEEGLGLVKDQAQARELFRKSASQGYAPAMVNLGRMYAEGIGGDRDDVGGYALIEAGVEAGIPASIREVALIELRTLSDRLDEMQLARARSLAREPFAAIEERAEGANHS